MAESHPVRFGILGCAEITRKVSPLSRAIALAPNAAVAAVASVSVDEAQRYAANNGYPDSVRMYGSYEAVLDDTGVDAVYVPLPTSLHVRWAVLAAEKKKHVLLEKPAAEHVAELDRILEACESNGVQFMDSTMWMHHPRTQKMADILADSRVFGQIKSIHSLFTVHTTSDFLENDIRLKPDVDALGVLGDLGWYCITSILWAVDYELPKSAAALPGTAFNTAGALTACGSSFRWEDGKLATFICSFLSNLTMDLTVVGTKGTLHVNDFVVPVNEKSAHFSIATASGFLEAVGGAGNWQPWRREHVVETELPQEVEMVREFCSLAGSKVPDKKWATISRKAQLLIDAVKASIEKGFEAVEIGS